MSRNQTKQLNFYQMEEEISKHVKKSYKTWREPKMSWHHKLKEIAIEIGIIVFAVMVSIYLHNWNEHRQERKEEKEFLTELREDLTDDIKEMKNDLYSYKEQINASNYFVNAQEVQTDSLKRYDWILFNRTFLRPNIDLIEGIRSSGKLHIIENKRLLRSLMQFYYEDVPNIVENGKSASNAKNETVGRIAADNDALVTDVINEKNTGEINHEFFKQKAFKRAFASLHLNFKETIKSYEKGINDAENLQKQIDEYLKE